MQIEFDPAKDKVNHEKHGVSLGFAREVLADPRCHVIADVRFDYGETRFIAHGRPKSDTRIWVCIYTPRGTTKRIISLRKANERETKRYYEAAR